MKRAVLISLLVVLMVFGVIAYASADTDSVVISASVNSVVEVTAPADHNFGALDPTGADPAPYGASVNVRSNTPYTIAQSYVSNTFPAGVLNITIPAAMDGTTSNLEAPSAAGFDWAVSYAIDLTPAGVMADAGSYSAEVLYTTVP